ncbi:hypothetical protein [Sporosalibacterium faouarense]|uniref:hypothetical protein n=1 Tax=Sporosalibacterium faouarense TaxID=516123 RepID=UPI00192CC51F|nr:hypothetical protein [Sporosalibacterium faouarense]
MGKILENSLWEEIELDFESENDFSSFFSSDGNIHSYPAKAVPNMINSLLLKLSDLYEISSVLDPFVGSGTIGLEAKYLGLDFYGSDLNPLSILLTQTKLMTIKKTYYIKKRVLDFVNDIIKEYEKDVAIPLVNFNNINYWFKEENIRELSYLKMKVNKFIKNSKKYKTTFALILLTAFSATIRYTSLSRNGEFKLYRMSPSDIKKFNVNSLEIYKKKIEYLLDMLKATNDTYKRETISQIQLKNAKNLDYLKDEKVDCIITSPPYGDSKSTVAYGQFSRLSIQWIGDLIYKYLHIKHDSADCDQYLLGGKKSVVDERKIYGYNSSKNLNELSKQMDSIISEDVEKYIRAKDKLTEIISNINQSHYLLKQELTRDEIVWKLIKERVRLEIYRNIKYNDTYLTNSKMRELAKSQCNMFFNELFNDKKKVSYKRIYQLRSKLPAILETINRKIKSLPSRKNEILDFFKDLYQVVLECDRVLKSGGIQTWIVGHRTVLGSITVNMESILSDWFKDINYEIITSLSRKYSFKRMPHHINSTITRKNKVKTMMNEYILIVKKS